ncbi:hypothetical protein Q4574_01460 [Aliiglaciecola sp. 3_MG-2023]|uniref:hypothetical protein n=1 Tax=Aliiglaciecola sp. 3_MG-2023 TaxID=3062644 RepID=UPI0026E3F9F5|nr:hypothetical protein [Aliiglaciecola sp. 3_MG-2023]MDO6691926.1 hypothetical protein [Aliiglaciecola sp. 3_MG-2023]
MSFDFIDINLPVVITFGQLGTSVCFDDALRGAVSPWGFEYIRSKGVNVLSFACINKPNWYRSQVFAKFLKKISLDIKCFPTRLGYGSSMGGFGVSVFANLLNINRVLLLNPISTLNSMIIPEETRFLEASTTYNWDGEYSDGANMKAGCSGQMNYATTALLHNLDISDLDIRMPSAIYAKLPLMGARNLRIL